MSTSSTVCLHGFEEGSWILGALQMGFHTKGLSLIDDPMTADIAIFDLTNKDPNMPLRAGFRLGRVSVGITVVLTPGDNSEVNDLVNQNPGDFGGLLVATTPQNVAHIVEIVYRSIDDFEKLKSKDEIQAS